MADPQPAAQPASAVGRDPVGRGLRPFDTASWEVASREHVAHLRKAMEVLLDLSGHSRREIERLLIARGCGFDVSRLLAGRFDLKLHQLLDVCRAIGVHPTEVVRLVFKEPRAPSPLVERMVALFGAAAAQPRLPSTEGPEQLPQLMALEQRLDGLERRVDELSLYGIGASMGDVRDSPPAPVGRDGRGFGEDLEERADAVRRLRIRAAASTPLATGRGRRS